MNANTKAAAEHGFFTKKPVTIQAWKWNESKATLKMIEREGLRMMRCEGHATNPDLCRFLSIETLEGSMRVDLGDWIIKGIKSEFYPCKPDIFEATYRPAEHHADDDEPVTEEWCLQNKWKWWEDEDSGEKRLILPLPALANPTGTDERWLEIEVAFELVAICRDSEIYDDDTPPDRVYTSITTRGQLRRLIAALRGDA